MSQFSFQLASTSVDDLRKESQYLSDSENEYQGTNEDQAHFALMKAYTLISATKCL